ncbi:MAG: hypothetical protein H6741_16395 [Alphaproteobacteria bacterium]|nr:hypothetical protein [Alphaproteobacteria bacterium]
MSAIIVLRPGVREADITPLAEAEGWILAGRAERTHGGFARTLWRSAEGERELLFQHDHRNEVLSLEVMGWEAQEVADSLRPRLPAWPVEELRAAVQDADPLVALQALRALAWAEWKAPSPEALAGARALLTHPREGARRATLRLVLMARWTALLPELEARVGEEEAVEGLLLWTLEQLKALEAEAQS